MRNTLSPHYETKGQGVCVRLVGVMVNQGELVRRGMGGEMVQRRSNERGPSVCECVAVVH